MSGISDGPYKVAIICMEKRRTKGGEGLKKNENQRTSFMNGQGLFTKSNQKFMRKLSGRKVSILNESLIKKCPRVELN